MKLTKWGWKREAPFPGRLGTSNEVWSVDIEGRIHRFPVQVTLGKHLELAGFRTMSQANEREYIMQLSAQAEAILAQGELIREVTKCPCCDAPAGEAKSKLVAYRFIYVECQSCLHLYVSRQLKPEALKRHFEESDSYAAVYTDRDAIEVRMQQVVAPKIQWALGVYELLYGAYKRPESVLDVGAGGGHFVAGAMRAGLNAMGYEISKASASAAYSNFSVQLLQRDFLADPEPLRAELITMWGLLEYVAQPLFFLEEARRRLSERSGMLIVEVPRANSLSTCIQQQFSDTIARHMDPTSHVNCFSDASILTALFRSGFKPVAAWYFGMDAYELMMQFSLNSNENLLSRFIENISPLQGFLDSGLLCDDIVIAAVPRFE
jgi:2-polyprenyl-3-methyl-5-hydroxy-6-metoxy-1,4-benzoquinol methylase